MEQINSQWSLESAFQEMRFNKNTHLGLGDIRLTMGVQEEIVKLSEKEKLKFAIEVLNKLDSILHAKCEFLTNMEILSNMEHAYRGQMKQSRFSIKKSGVKLAKEEIRREINDLTNLISQLWHNTK